MTDGPFPRDRERPVVWIYAVSPVSEGGLTPLLWGLEEEGIPGKVRPFPEAQVETLAEQAAENSPFSVGIGVNETTGAALLQHRDLIGHGPLFVLKGRGFEPSELRRLGVNAARLVKRMPLVMEPEGEGGSENRNPVGYSPESWEDLVSRIVEHILKHSETRPGRGGFIKL